MARRNKSAGAPRTSPLPFVLMILVLAGFGFVIWRNSSSAPAVPLVPNIPTQQPPTQNPNPIADLLRQGFGENSTPLPTVAIPSAAPTIAQMVLSADMTMTPISAADLSGQGSLVLAQASTPTLPPPSSTPVQAGEVTPIVLTANVPTRSPDQWQPPPLIPPLSRDPLGRDHYWFLRPIDSNARNWVLSVYPYGSDGNDRNNPLRVHHGVDMPNDVGELVRAAGSGTVIWAADGRQATTDIFQNSPSYGNVVVIEHDFGYQGQPMWTLYAHLSAALVQQGQVVQAGEPIGLVGNTGRVTGPHVHFEVRVVTNRYGSTYNPVLWMVPYVGHGVIAGVVLDSQGERVQDADITIRNWATGVVETTTTSYVTLDSGFDVNADPIWQENFAVPDIPVGRYDVITTIEGVRVVRQIVVNEGTTSFVELKPSPAQLASPSPSPSPEAGESGG